MNEYARLKNSPVFQMSLHSKELFYSNFLAWLGEDPELRGIFRNVMEAIGVPSEYIDSWGDNFEVLREKYNFDILVKTPDLQRLKKKDGGRFYLVIENKIKSIPSNEQLQEYSDKLEQAPIMNDRTLKILLSISEYEGKIPDGWKRATYSQVIEGLDKPISNEISLYKKELIKDFTSVLKCLVEIMRNIKVSLDDNFLTDQKADKLISQLDSLRIADLYQKRRISMIANLVSEELNEHCTPGYTNKTPLLDINLPFDGKDANLSDCVGALQIQGIQYRHCIWGKVETDELSTNFPNFIFKDKDSFEKAMDEEYPGVFAGTGMRGNFCYYGKDDDKPFIYQYVKIAPATTIRQIIECIREDLEKLENFKRNYNPEQLHLS